MRVPVADGSIVDLVVRTREKVTVERVNEAIVQASESDRLRGILGTTDEPLVSSDIIGDERSAVVDLRATRVIAGRHLRCSRGATTSGATPPGRPTWSTRPRGRKSAGVTSGTR